MAVAAAMMNSLNICRGEVNKICYILESYKCCMLASVDHPAFAAAEILGVRSKKVC